jgi:hypothetical protein
VRADGTPPAGPRGLGGGRGAARLTANFSPIEDAKANFFGAHGNVVSGAISVAAGGGAATLLELTEANLVVTATVDHGEKTTIAIHNGAPVPLQAAQALDGTVTQVSLPANNEATIELPDEHIHRLHLQIYPSRPEFPDVVTLLLSSEHGSIVGQAFVSAIE